MLAYIIQHSLHIIKKHFNYVAGYKFAVPSFVISPSIEVCLSDKEKEFMLQKGVPIKTRLLYYDKKYIHPEVYFSIVNNVTLYGNSGAVVSENKIYIESVGNEKRLNDCPSYRNLFYCKEKIKKGVYTSIINIPYCRNHYFHFVVENLPRLYSLTRFKNQVTLIVNDDIDNFQLELINLVLKKNPHIQIQYINTNEKWRLDEFILLSFPSNVNSGYLPSPLLGYLREIFIDGYGLKRETKKNRIFISRSKAKQRRLINEEEIWGFLIQNDFKILFLEEMTNEEKAQLFYNAEIVIGTFGAGMTNIFLTDPGTFVLEIFSSDFINCHYMLSAKSSNLNYTYLIGSEMKNSSKDFVLDIGEFKEKVDSILKHL